MSDEGQGRAEALFHNLLVELRQLSGLSQKQMAEEMGISAVYLCDIEKGRRLPSVKFVNTLCTYLGRGPQGRLVWHRAAAKAHGWEI